MPTKTHKGAEVVPSWIVVRVVARLEPERKTMPQDMWWTVLLALAVALMIVGAVGLLWSPP